MLKKDSTVKLSEEAIKSFNLVKFALSNAPVLISPDYTQDFIIFSFAKVMSIARWKVAPAFFSPNGILVYWKVPQGVVKAVLSWSFSCTKIWL